MEKEMTVEEMLREKAEEGYRAFTAKLVPGKDPSTILGVRMPELRRIAKTIKNTAQAEAFTAALPHRFHEENQLHGLLINEMKDVEACFEELERFLPQVDNWATCDLLSPKIFKKYPGRVREKIGEWLSSDRPYTVRFGLETLMNFYLDDRFEESVIGQAAKVASDEYYVKMMIAWFFATALAKQWTAALAVIEQKRLDPWTHNKTIQKACESYRLSEEQKALLRRLKIKVK